MKRMGFQSHFATDDVYNKKRNCTELMQQALCQIGMSKYRDIIHEHGMKNRDMKNLGMKKLGMKKPRYEELDMKLLGMKCNSEQTDFRLL